MATIAKEERIEVRLAALEKKRFKVAADLLDLNLSEFMLASAREAAEHALASQTRFVLPARQMQAFYGSAGPTSEAPAGVARVVREAQRL